MLTMMWSYKFTARSLKTQMIMTASTSLNLLRIRKMWKKGERRKVMGLPTIAESTAEMYEKYNIKLPID